MGYEGKWYEQIENGGEYYVKMDVWFDTEETNRRVDGLTGSCKPRW